MSKRVLLTGANGFVGSHVLSQLLLAGYSVRSIVRSSSKASQVLSDFPNHGTNLDFGIVPDITSAGAFDEVNRDFLDPAIKGTLEVLKSVKKNAPSVERVVITSSLAAVVDFSAGSGVPRRVYTEEDWNTTPWEAALFGTPNTGYQASKKFAELATWDFMKAEKPNFDLVTLTPPMVYGPIRHSISSPKELSESNSRIYKLFIDSKKDADLPPNGMHVYTDDLALAHLKAATVPEAAGQRFIICAGQVPSQQKITPRA